MSWQVSDLESWKPIKEYEGLYEISSHGRIKSLSKRGSYKERFLKPWVGEQYSVYILTKNNIPKTYKIARLVAEHFVDNSRKERTVNHIDGNKKNNNVKNLEWCSYSDNQKHAYRTGLKSNAGIKNPRAKLSVKDVIFIRLNQGLMSTRELSNKFGICQVTVLDIWIYKRWKNV